MTIRYLLPIATLASAAILSGCGTPGAYGGSYQNPADRLRDVSLEQAALLSKQTKAYLDGGKSEQEAIDAAQKALAGTLKDPGAAQFRNVRMVDYLEGKVICGEVNGKNSYGAYIGFRSFVAGPSSSVLESRNSRYQNVDWLANTGLRAACT